MKTRTWYAAVAAAGTSLILLTACGNTQGATREAADAKYPEIAELVPQDVRDKGTLPVPMDGDYPPEHFAEDGVLKGFNPEFTVALGEVLNLDLKPTLATFDSLIPGIQAGRYQMAAADVYVTEERSEVVDFVTYLYSGSSIMTTAENPEGFAGLDSLCGARAAVQNGTAHVDDLAEQSDKCEDAGEDPIVVDVYGKQSDATTALLSGQADFSALGSSAAGYAALQNPKLHVTEQYSGFKGGIIVPKGEREWAEALKAGIEQLIADGTYEKLLEKWGLETAAIEEVEILP